MKILSCGAGMQSTALALMACENVKIPNKYPLVPIYDAIVFCDLGSEPKWVYDQVLFIQDACKDVQIPFYVIEVDLYNHYMNNFGYKRVVSIPFWSIDTDGKKGKMLRNCTLEFKIQEIEKFVKYELLHYRKYEKMRPEDYKAHEFHLGFSIEESHRCKDNPHKMFVNKFPLVDMLLERKDNYAYIRDVWGLDTKASACIFCPFHRNVFYNYLKTNLPTDYERLITFDTLLETNQPYTNIRSKLYVSRSRKRIEELSLEECQDAETFPYKNKDIWNGF